MELFQHYGLTSVPPASTMAVVLPVGGRTRHSIVIASKHSTSTGWKGWQTTRWRSTVRKAPKSLSGAKELSRWNATSIE
ncbi:MAG: phage baseplate assembly protein domain-containing protein [Sodalis sp. (in: enterobacteria)]|uniref:phage baseplate assembly protein domain-containing protein n=1 Tax=Sodalis sp. (in: enterobacteria) TaxID=1898979 RepID=UPI003F3F9024